MVIYQPKFETIDYDQRSFPNDPLDNHWYASCKATIEFKSTVENYTKEWWDEFIDWDVCRYFERNPHVYLQWDGTWKTRTAWFPTKKTLMKAIHLHLLRN